MKFIRSRVFTTILLLISINAFNQALAQKSKNVQQFTKEIDAQGAKSVRLEITQSAGTLQVRGGATKLLEGDFAFTKGEWKPVIVFTTETGKLVVKQPDNNRSINMDNGDSNEWKIRLNNRVPMEMNLSLGAGEGTIDLQGMKLTDLQMKAGAGKFAVKLGNTTLQNLDINAGVGEMKLDLTGKWNNSLTANIKAGIGSIDLILPRFVGARVKVSGLGSIEANGFKQQDGYYVNDAYNKSTHQLTIDISGGLGNVTLQMDK
jgi:hypothetical protein